MGKSGKRGAESDEEVRVKISALEIDETKLPPIVGYFPSRYSALEKREAATVSVYRNLNRIQRLQLKVKPDASDLRFVGTNYKGETTRPQLCSYALGVFDKTTKLLNIVPIAANKIFRLEPEVGETEDPEDAPQNEFTREERAEAVKNLQLEYSTKKAEREYKKKHALRANDDEETRQHLDRKIESISMPELAIEVGDSSVNERNVPPYDLEASDPSRVYPLERIIFKGEWEYLLDVYNICQGGGEVTTEVYPTFVCNRVHKLETMENENEKKKLSGIFSFMTHLIKFKDKCSMDRVRSATRHKIPGILSLKFSSMFVDSESRVLSTEKIELLIGYVLVLTLFVDDFRSDVTDIAKDLKMSFVQLRSYYENLGCKIVRENQMMLATLRVPLKFPPTNRRKRRRT